MSTPTPSKAECKHCDFTRQMGITLLDAKWLDPECHKGCKSLVLKNRIAQLERELEEARNPRRHDYWGAGELDCPPEIKARNGNLHTLQCKVCGLKNPKDQACRPAGSAPTFNP